MCLICLLTDLIALLEHSVICMNTSLEHTSSSRVQVMVSPGLWFHLWRSGLIRTVGVMAEEEGALFWDSISFFKNAYNLPFPSEDSEVANYIEGLGQVWGVPR